MKEFEPFVDADRAAEFLSIDRETIIRWAAQRYDPRPPSWCGPTPGMALSVLRTIHLGRGQSTIRLPSVLGKATMKRAHKGTMQLVERKSGLRSGSTAGLRRTRLENRGAASVHLAPLRDSNPRPRPGGKWNVLAWADHLTNPVHAI
jgi:hypothetical protein